jgi:xyloglucan-specific exo-beta-1,4-glucanase
VLKKGLLSAFLFLVAYAAHANFAIFQLGNVSPSTNISNTVFSHIQIGGGGAVIGVASLPSSNLLLAKTDQFGCYKSVNNSQWSQLITTTSVPSDGVAALTAAGAPLGQGADECVPDPGNSSNIWMGTNGSIYLSTNGGTTFSTTCYPAQGASNSQAQNQSIKGMGHTIAVDPNNSNVVYMSTPSNGLEFSKDQGATCSLVSTGSIPLASAALGGSAGGGHLIAFDTSGGTTTVSSQTRTAIVYATSYGHGLYKSSDGGQTWTIQNSAGMPTTFWYMAADNKGNVWVVDDSIGQVGAAFKYNGSTTWTSLSGTIATPTSAVAVDPNNCASAGACHITFVEGGGNSTGTCETQNGGSTWNCARSQSFTTTDVPWIHDWIVNFGLFPSGAAFDNSGHVYTGGEGVYFTTPATSGSTAAFTSQTVGIEEALSSSVVTSPNTSGSVVLATWDINCFTLSQPYSSFPQTANRGCGSTNSASLQHTYNTDWASSAPSTFVALTDNQGGYLGGGYTNYSAISSDGGVTWGTALQAPSGVTSSGLIAGCIAASSPTNVLWAPTDGSGGNVAPLYSTNAGVSATYSSISTGATGGWPWRYFLDSKICAADRVTANTFYLYNWNNGSSQAFYKCSSSGASCSTQSTPSFANSTQFIPILKHVPNIGSGVGSGHLFFSYATGTPFSDDATFGFYYSTDGFATKTQISNWTMVAAYGFGAPFPGHTYPTIVAVGFYNHVWGIYRSIDWDGAKTWQQIGTYPLNLPVTIKDIDGDKSQANVFYYATNSGFFCSAPSTTYCNGGT